MIKIQELIMVSPPCSPFLIDINKILNASIVCFFNIIRKIAGWQFMQAAMIMKAITTHSFLFAGIGTGAITGVTILFTLHIKVHYFSFNLTNFSLSRAFLLIIMEMVLYLK